MRNYSFTLFTCFCFRLLWLWFVFFKFCFSFALSFCIFMRVSGLGCLFPFGDLCFWFLVVFFCFGFPILSCVFLFWVCSFLFLFLLLLSCGFFVSISHPIYLIVLCKSNHWRTLQNSVENFFIEIRSFR